MYFMPSNTAFYSDVLVQSQRQEPKVFSKLDLKASNSFDASQAAAIARRSRTRITSTFFLP